MMFLLALLALELPLGWKTVLPLLPTRVESLLVKTCLPLGLMLVLEEISVPVVAAVLGQSNLVLLGWYGSLSDYYLRYQIPLTILVIEAVEYLLVCTLLALSTNPASGTEALPPSQPSGQW